MFKTLFSPRISAVIAFIGYGSWAAFSNRLYSLGIVLKAFFAQGIFAFVATLLLGSAACYLYDRRGSTRKAALLSFGFSFALICSVPSILHWIIGTPEIITTILPGLVWGTLYIGILLFTKHMNVGV